MTTALKNVLQIFCHSRPRAYPPVPTDHGEMGWWRDIKRGNGTKKVGNHGFKRMILLSVIFISGLHCIASHFFVVITYVRERQTYSPLCVILIKGGMWKYVNMKYIYKYNSRICLFLTSRSLTIELDVLAICVQNRGNDVTMSPCMMTS